MTADTPPSAANEVISRDKKFGMQIIRGQIWAFVDHAYCDIHGGLGRGLKRGLGRAIAGR